MHRWILLIVLLGAVAALVVPAFARHHRHRNAAGAAPGLADATMLVIRHAEKPTTGAGLASAGVARAQGYATYFRRFVIDGRTMPIVALIASADSDASARPRLTLEPLARATGLKVQTPFKNKQYEKAARWIAQSDVGPDLSRGAALIAWHHGKLPELLKALGAEPASVLPNGAWPEDVYDWVIVLRYDHDGRLASARRIVEPTNLD